MRDFQLAFREPHHAASEYIEPPACAELFRLAEEDLQPEADAKVWFLLLYCLNHGIYEFQVGQFSHAVPEGADTGQDHSISAQNGSGIARYLCLYTDLEKSLFNAPEVPHSVIDNRDHTLYYRFLNGQIQGLAEEKGEHVRTRRFLS